MAIENKNNQKWTYWTYSLMAVNLTTLWLWN